MPVLEVQNIEKRFGATHVLQNITFSLEEGQALAVIGSSGSGKTTLLRCLNFLERPDRGSITVRGELLFDAADPAAQQEAQVRRKRLHFGLVFQSFNLFPQYTALENVALACRLLAQERPDFRANRAQILKEIDERAYALLEQMGLCERAGHYPHQLSGGQQQRVAIARALATKPAIVLADEPTGNLDSRTSQDVLSLMKITSQRFGQTIVMITHNEEIAQLADRIIRIEDGQIRHSEGR